MASIIYVGMDVHKDTYSLCSFDAQRNLLFSQTQMKSTTENVVRYLKKVSQMNGDALTVCGYEAGPTGFGLCRELQKQGFACVIMAPTSIAKTAKDKAVKTDKSDAQMLARTLAFHSYKEVVLPSENTVNFQNGSRRSILSQNICPTVLRKTIQKQPGRSSVWLSSTGN